MRNIETRCFDTNASALIALLNNARAEERRDRALAVSLRLEALAVHITQHGMDSKETAELLRREAARFEHESQEVIA